MEKMNNEAKKGFTVILNHHLVNEVIIGTYNTYRAAKIAATKNETYDVEEHVWYKPKIFLACDIEREKKSLAELKSGDGNYNYEEAYPYAYYDYDLKRWIDKEYWEELKKKNPQRYNSIPL